MPFNETHRPVLVYFDPDKSGQPAEVCGTCTNAIAGRWVPVTECALSAAQLPPLSEQRDSDYAETTVWP